MMQSLFNVLKALPLLGMALWAGIPTAAAIELGLPLDCEPGKTCWIVNYVDIDTRKGKWTDFKCGWRTYDTHKGVDFGISDLRQMKQGVNVLAAAPGVVAGTRDGMTDISFRDLSDPTYIDGKECGNGVVVIHEDGWRSQYCHLKKNSVAVGKGDQVQRGQVLGKVGLSGRTEFPHLHIQVLRDKKIVDPFQGRRLDGKCGDPTTSLWQKGALDGFHYGPAIYLADFSASQPNHKTARKGLYRDKVLGAQSPALVLWADFFGLEKGDKVRMEIVAPDGSLFAEHKATMVRNAARRFLFAGKKRKKLFWNKGVYQGSISVVRAAGTAKEKKYTVTRQVEIR